MLGEQKGGAQDIWRGGKDSEDSLEGGGAGGSGKEKNERVLVPLSQTQHISL